MEQLSSVNYYVEKSKLDKTYKDFLEKYASAKYTNRVVWQTVTLHIRRSSNSDKNETALGSFVAPVDHKVICRITHYLGFTFYEPLSDMVVPLTANYLNEQHKEIHAFRKWARHHEEDFSAGFLSPDFELYLQDQICPGALPISAYPLPMTVTVGSCPIGFGETFRVLKKRFRPEEMLEITAKMRSVRDTISSLTDDYPGLEMTRTWKTFLEDLENTAYDSPDDSDTDSVERVSLKKKTSQGDRTNQSENARGDLGL